MLFVVPAQKVPSGASGCHGVVGSQILRIPFARQIDEPMGNPKGIVEHLRRFEQPGHKHPAHLTKGLRHAGVSHRHNYITSLVAVTTLVRVDGH